MSALSPDRCWVERVFVTTDDTLPFVRSELKRALAIARETMVDGVSPSVFEMYEYAMGREEWVNMSVFVLMCFAVTCPAFAKDVASKSDSARFGLFHRVAERALWTMARGVCYTGASETTTDPFDLQYMTYQHVVDHVRRSVALGAEQPNKRYHPVETKRKNPSSSSAASGAKRQKSSGAAV